MFGRDVRACSFLGTRWLRSRPMCRCLIYGSVVGVRRRCRALTATYFWPKTVKIRCDPAVVVGSKELDLIRQRLVYFLQGKWCVPVTGKTGDEGRAAADCEMQDWFAAAEQVCLRASLVFPALPPLVASNPLVVSTFRPSPCVCVFFNHLRFGAAV